MSKQNDEGYTKTADMPTKPAEPNVMSVAMEIDALALLNIRDILNYILTAEDDEIEKRYATEERAVAMAEKILNIALKAGILEHPLKGWSLKYTQPTGRGDRVEHNAVFFTRTECAKEESTEEEQ